MSGRGGRASLAVAVAAVTALVVVAYLLVAERRETARLRQDTARLSSEVTRLDEELTGARDQIAQLEQARDAAGAGGLLDEGQASVDELLRRLLEQGGVGGLEGLELPEGLDLGAIQDLLEGAGGTSLEELQDLLGELGGAAPGPEAPGAAAAANLLSCIGADGPGGIGAQAVLGGDPVTAGDAAAQVAAITDRVVELRELDRDVTVDPTFLTQAQIAARAREIVAEEYTAEDADLDRRVLAALGAVPADIDLRQVQADLLGDQIAGFYDTETRELVVRVDDPDAPLDTSQQLTLAHEVEHALADANFDLDMDDTDQPTDAARAGLAIVEGDATLTMQRFATGAVGLAGQLGLAFDPAVAASRAQLERFPHYLQRELAFPYEDGLAFVCDRFADGGWDAVDALYAARPRSTAEVLFPDRYGTVAPVEPRAPGNPSGGDPSGGGWREARTDSLGAADLLWLFEAPGDDTAAALDDPRGRVAAWAGGRATLHVGGGDGNATALGVALVDGGEGPRLCDSVTAWYRAAFPDDADARGAAAGTPDVALARDGAAQDAVVVCDGDEVRLGVAPDLATAGALAG